MNKPSIKDEILLAIQKVLKPKVNFAEAKLVDGTVVMADAFEVGKELKVVAADGSEALAPDGDHTLEDGTVVTVASGLITAIKPVETAEETEIEIEMSNLKAKIAELESKLNESQTQLSKVEASKKETETKLSKVEELVKQLEDKPAAKPISKSAPKVEKTEMSAIEWASMTPEQRVFFKLNN